MSGTQLWLSELIPNDDTAVTGPELATLWLRVLHPNFYHSQIMYMYDTAPNTWL